MKITRKLIIGRYRIDLVLLAFTVKLLIVCIALGFWQLQRLKEKNSLLAGIEIAIISEAKKLNEVKTENILYSRLVLEGRFLEGQDIYLYGRRTAMQEKDGYYLLTPFQTLDNKVIAVARGWFSHSNKELVGRSLTSSSNIERITGIALPGEQSRMLVPGNDIKNRIWFTLDLSQMSKLLGQHVENFYLLQTSPQAFDFLHPLSPNIVLRIRNDHKEYAITWFSLAFVLVVMFVIYSRQKVTI